MRISHHIMIRNHEWKHRSLMNIQHHHHRICRWAIHHYPFIRIWMYRFKTQIRILHLLSIITIQLIRFECFVQFYFFPLFCFPLLINCDLYIEVEFICILIYQSSINVRFAQISVILILFLFSLRIANICNFCFFFSFSFYGYIYILYYIIFITVVIFHSFSFSIRCFFGFILFFGVALICLSVSFVLYSFSLGFFWKFYGFYTNDWCSCFK